MTHLSWTVYVYKGPQGKPEGEPLAGYGATPGEALSTLLNGLDKLAAEADDAAAAAHAKATTVRAEIEALT